MSSPAQTVTAVLRSSQPTPWTRTARSASPSGTAHSARCTNELLAQPTGLLSTRSATVKPRTRLTSDTTATSTAPRISLARASCQRFGATRKLVAAMPNRYSVVTIIEVCTSVYMESTTVMTAAVVNGFGNDIVL